MTNFCVTLWVWELWRTFEGQILDNYKQRATIITEIFIAVRGFCSVMMRCSLSYWTNASQGLNVDTVIWLKLYMFPRRRELPDCLTLFLPCKACEPRQKCSICSLPRSIILPDLRISKLKSLHVFNTHRRWGLREAEVLVEPVPPAQKCSSE